MNAIYLGNFSPLTNFQVKELINLKRKYDRLIILVTNDKPGLLTFTTRFRTIREIFSQDELVATYMYDESISAEENIDILRRENNEYVVYNTTNLIIKEQIKLNDYTKTEELFKVEPYKNYDLVNKYFKKFYNKKVLIYGTASTGKTTLTKDLAQYYNTSYSLEYAREYEEVYNLTDDELDITDLTNMGMGQYNQNKRHINSPATNKIFFADTDVMTTLNYVSYYNGDDEHYNDVKGIFEGLISKQKWDLVLFLQPDTEYVDDGFRDMNHSSKEFREEFNALFRNKLETYNVEYYEISGTFEDRFSKSVELCDEIIK